MKKTLKGFVCFWLWIAVILVSFMMLVVSVVVSPIPGVAITVFALVVSPIPGVAITVFALVIFALSISMAIINPGIFVKQTTSATGI